MASYPSVTRNSRSRMLFTCHDAGGTIPPVLAVAEALVAQGHEVVILSQPSVRMRAEALGCTFVAFTKIGDYERHTSIEEQLDVVLPAMTGTTVGDDLLDVAARHSADVVVVDANLAGGLAAAESLDRPSVVLLHSLYKTYVDTWFGEVWPFLEPGVNKARGQYGLAAANGWPAVFAAHDRLLSVVPAVFDAPVAELPDAMRYFGFLVPRGRPVAGSAGFPAGDAPTVLVGLSTTYADQQPMLSAILDALAGLAVRGLVATAGVVDERELPHPSNVTITDYVPHSLVLDQTDVMVTHAGLGSVAGAMEFGVPVVCMPGDRDQPLNAQRVADLGAGITLPSSAGAEEIAAAIQRLLTDGSYREAARALGAASRDAGGATAAAAEIERLLD